MEETKKYSNEQGEVMSVKVPNEAEHNGKEYKFKVRGYNNDSGMYYMNSGLTQYEGEIRYPVNNFSSAFYINESNKSIFRKVVIENKGVENLPIPEGFVLQGGREILERPIPNQEELISDNTLKDEQNIQ